MTLELFCRLSPEVQLRYTFIRGTFLTHRWEGDGPRMLHHVPDKGRGFFVEIGTDEEQTQFFVLRSFSDSEALADYAHGVRLLE